MLRKKKGLTQKQLAGILGIDQTAVSNWERGKSLPDNSNQLKLANYFNVSRDYLLGRDPTDDPPLTLGNFSIDLIAHAEKNGLSKEDLVEFIDFVNRIKQKNID